MRRLQLVPAVMTSLREIACATKTRLAAAPWSILAAGLSLWAFLRSRKGGAVLISSISSIGVLALTGSLMTNYAYREYQYEELRMALRAAVSSAAPLLPDIGDPDINQQIKKRIAEFAQGTLPGLRLDASDVTVAHDAATGITTISTSGAFAFQDLWVTGGSEGYSDGTSEAVDTSIAVKFEVDKFEVAVALDISGSMSRPMPGAMGSKLDSLKNAMETVTDVVQTASSNNPGSFLVSIVPFTSAVNVADTGGTGQTPAKERYLRLLAGAPGVRLTVADTLRAAKDAVADGKGQWVDTFNYYGVGNDLGPLRTLGLPQDLLDNVDWNLRRTNVELDVSAQVPALDKWVVDDEDFWNGCVMARWGAYWDPDARPVGWVADDPANWPSAKAVPGWTAMAASLPASTPLHLSDAPPDADDPHSLFTAYSWPDSRIGGQADHRLQTVMARLVDQSAGGLDIFSGFAQLTDIATQADNDWSSSDGRGGATLCPLSPILPLTDDFAVLRQAVTNLNAQPGYRPGYGSILQGTYLNLGIVWGLRTLSPLWQQVWQVSDLRGVSRPEIPCAPSEDYGCDPDLHKSILIISDGASVPALQIRSRLGEIFGAYDNPSFADSPICSQRSANDLKSYFDAAVEASATDFNNHFTAYLSGGHFGGAGMDLVLDAFQLLDRWPNDTPARRGLRSAVLQGLSPWQLFRGLDADVTDALMDEANEFGFDRRPVQVEHFCRPSSMFSPYGRTDDRILVGKTDTLPSTSIAPVANAAPFNVAGLSTTIAGDRRPDTGSFGWFPALMYTEMANRLDGWLLESCRIAGERQVRVNAIFIGDTAQNADQIAILESCVDAAGGTPGHQDVFVTPDAEALENAFTELFTVRRNLRFLD